MTTFQVFILNAYYRSRYSKIFFKSTVEVCVHGWDIEAFLTEENHHVHGELVTQNLKLKYIDLTRFPIHEW